MSGDKNMKYIVASAVICMINLITMVICVKMMSIVYRTHNSNGNEYKFHCPVCNEQLEYEKANGDSNKIVCPDCGLIFIFSPPNRLDEITVSDN